MTIVTDDRPKGPFTIKSPHTDCGFVYGTVVWQKWRGQEGYRFMPNVNNRRPSIKVYDTVKAAIPPWAKPYILELPESH